MPSLYKPAGRKHYHTSFYVPEGDGMKHITKSTGKTKRSEALIRAVELEKLALTEAGAGAEKSASIYEILKRAGEDALKGILNTTKAREYLSEITQVATGESLVTYTIEEWVKEWLARQEGVSVATTRAYTTNTKSFLKWLGERKTGTLHSLTVEDMREYRLWLKNGDDKRNPSSANTVKQKMKTVSSIYIEAMKQGLVNFNPTAALKPLQEQQKLQRKPFTHDEVKKLIAAAPDQEWEGMITVGAYTGLRLNDCANLKWENVDLDRLLIKVTPRKTIRKQVEVTIPIHPTLESFFKYYPHFRSPQEFIFPSCAGKTDNGRNGLSKQFIDIMAEAGVSRGKSTSDTGKTFYERSFHSLRHTLTSWLADANVSPEVRMKIIGHKSSDIHSLYTHLGEGTLQTAMSSVPSI